MLIRGAEIEGQYCADVRIDGARIAQIACMLSPQPGEEVVEAAGAALFPGLNDHHIHLAAYAAALDSVLCGPPAVVNVQAFEALLAGLNVTSREWLRGIGYHDSVAGLIDRTFLDRVIPLRPVRIQHRSGRLWIFNSAALDALAPQAEDPLERAGGRLTGRLYDGDAWLRQRLPGRFPDLARASRILAERGVTGVTDASASNNRETLGYLAAARERGELLQSILVMGDDSLNGLAHAGPRKFHLHDADLPDFDETVRSIARAHEAGRAAAFHCVTRGELTFALAALETAGARSGDRIEHASVSPPELVEMMRRLSVTVVTQPNFIFERGDRYISDVPDDDLPWLYRAAGFRGIPLAGGTDAPFGAADPWRLMDAAVRRTTSAGRVMGPEERLSPEVAIGLLLGRLENPGGPARRVAQGEAADLVLLDRSWKTARADLAAIRVQATFISGKRVFTA